MFPHSDQLFGEDAHVRRGLLLLRRVALAAFVGLRDEVAGFGFEGFEVREVAVEFPGVGADEGVAFLFLKGVLEIVWGYMGSYVVALPVLQAKARRRSGGEPAFWSKNVV